MDWYILKTAVLYFAWPERIIEVAANVVRGPRQSTTVSGRRRKRSLGEFLGGNAKPQT
jgi:hypothetical protein